MADETPTHQQTLTQYMPYPPTVISQTLPEERHSLSSNRQKRVIYTAPRDPFLPHPLLRSGDIQTFLARIKPRASALPQREQPLLFDGGPDRNDRAVVDRQTRQVQLLGYYTAAVVDNPRRGLVLLLHGWEGCSHSVYSLAIADALNQVGFDVVRLNFRDHGPNLHLDKSQLNPGIFLGTLIDEVADATAQIATLAGGQSFYLIGISLGGNFVLRLALRHNRQPIANLHKVIAINPAMNPACATDNVDAHPFYRRYFRRRWLSSLLAKQALYPDLYNFDALRSCYTLRTMTERLVQDYRPRFGPFQSADEYFAAYTVEPTVLADVAVPTEIISAQDDPIISATDFAQLPDHDLLSLQLHPTGGHVGYIDLFPLQHHLPRLVLASLLEQECTAHTQHFGKVSTL